MRERRLSEQESEMNIKMTTTQTEAIRKLFNYFKIKNVMEKYLLYLHALIARSVFSSYQEEKRFTDYEDAWRSQIALAMRDYLPKDDVDIQLISSLAKEIDGTTGLDFIQEIVPDLLPRNIELLFEYLEQDRRKKTDRTLFYLLLKVWTVIQVQIKTLAKSYPVSVTQLKKEDISALLYEEYLNWQKNYPKYAEIRNFEEKEFFKTWCLIYGSLFAPVSVTVKRKLSKHLEMLMQKNCPEETILAYYFMARTGKRFKLKEIGSLWDYFQVVFSEKITEKDRERSRSLGEMFFQEKEIFEECMEEWRDISPEDFLRTFYYFGKRDASEIIEWENCVVYSRLKQMLLTSSSAIITDPNPDFIFRCMNDASCEGKKLLFVLPSEALAQIYEAEFSGKAPFAYISTKKSSAGTKSEVELQETTKEDQSQQGEMQGIMRVLQDTTHWGKEIIFQEEKIDVKYEIGIIFSRQKSLQTLPSFVKIIQEIISKDGTLLLHIPQSLVNEKRYGILGLLPQSACDEILLLPNNPKSEWLKKRLLMIFHFDKQFSSNEIVSVWKSFSVQFEETGNGNEILNREFICQEPWSIDIPKQKIFSERKTINRLWEQYRPRPKRGNPRGTKCFHFSREITIWYSLSNGRGKFAYYDIPSSAQTNKNPLARGKRLTKSMPFRAQNTSEAERKIQEKMFQTPIKDTIQKTIQKSYRDKPLSLKSFWFCSLDKLSEKDNYKESIMMDLVFSPSFTDILSTDKISLEEYEQRMEKDFGDQSEGKKLVLWRQLNLLLNYGGSLFPRCFYPNPISSYVYSLIERDLDLQRMRRSLAKRSYTQEEETVILDEIRRNLPQSGIYLGAAISFYTGMQNNEICALNWDDYQSFAGRKGKQLLVYKYVKNNGEIRSFGTERKSAYRRIPLIEALKELLEKRKNHVLEILRKSFEKEAEERLKALPIVTSDEIDFQKRCTSTELKKNKDSLENAAGIEPMEGSVAEDEQEDRRTDFNRYQGDRFRENFRQKTITTCLMTVAERNYLLGIALPDTFSKHYCDYLNDISQLTMGKKLERWTVLHQQKDAQYASEIALTGEKQVIRLSKSKCNSRVCVDLDMILKPLGGEVAQLILNVTDNCGVELDLYTLAQ